MTDQRTFRFGVLASGARDAEAWRQQAADAESLGYRSFCVPDHQGQEWAPLVALAIAACATTRIALGTLVLAADLRLPSVLFKELATLAQVAPGRLEIGLGAGWLAKDFQRAGLPMAPAAERIARLDEAVTILKKLWQDRSVTFEGTYYTITEAAGQPVPPPGGARWVLGGGGRKMLAVAAAHADVISLGAQLSNSGKGSEFGRSAVLDRFDERVSWIRADTGDRFDDIELGVLVQVCSITDDRDRYASRVLTRMFDLSGDDALASPLTLVGSADQIRDKLLRLRDRLDVSYWVVPAAQMRPFAEVVDRLDGGSPAGGIANRPQKGSNVRVLGLGGSHHDFCACVVVDGSVVSAVEEERLTRVKLAFGLGPRLQRCLAGQYVLDEAGLRLDDIDLVIANDFINPVYTVRMADRIRWIGHHLAHAASTFYSSPFDRCAVLVMDGRGSDVPTDDGLFCETITGYVATGEGLRPVTAHTGRVTLTGNRLEDPYEDSVGWMYEIVSKCIGFVGPGAMGEPGKTMGLAAYGSPRYVKDLAATYALADGQFRQSAADQRRMRSFVEGELSKAASQQAKDEIRADFAYAIQQNTERIVLEIVRWLHALTGERRLCLAGGVALNSVANFKILEETPFEELHIVPAAGDSGTGIGAALYGYHELGGHQWKPACDPFSPYLGREYGQVEIDAAIAGAAGRIRCERPGDICAAVAAELDRGAVIGWFQGRSEIGPRALGNRSILADPRPAGMKDKINAKVKHREPFRPFAPIVRQHRQGEFFATEIPAPYMLLVPAVRLDKREVIAAVTHVDGSARLQTVFPQLNPKLDALLAAFERLTGIPVLLNTSFNDNNEPIVETPADAMRCFLNTGIDLLVLGDVLISKVAGLDQG